MTTEAQFQAALDADPSDHMTRLAFADWLEEQDPPDPRAAGYRALGMRRTYAYFVPSSGYSYGDYSCQPDDHSDIPTDWLAEVDSEYHLNNSYDGGKWVGFSSRKLADDTIARAFARLPAHRRAALLATPTEARA